MKTLWRVLINAAILCVSAVSFLLLTELGLRAAHFNPPEYVTTERYREVGLLYRPHSSAHWYGQLGSPSDYANVVTTNAQGLHDADHSFEKPPGVYRILFLGDSYVEAFQVPLEKAFFKIIEKELNKDPARPFGAKKVEVIAIGRSGAGSAQEILDLVDLGLKYSPDLVLAELLDQNDFKDDLFFTVRQKKPEPTKRTDFVDEFRKTREALAPYDRVLLFKNSLLNRWIAFQVMEFIRKPEAERSNREIYRTDLAIYEKPGSGLFDDSRGAWENAFKITVSNHVRMKQLAEAAGARYAVFFPDNPMIYNPACAKGIEALFPAYKGGLDYTRPISRAKAIFDRAGVPYADLNPVFEQNFRKKADKGHWQHDGHWNVHGHKLTAEYLKNYVIKNFGGRPDLPKERGL
jgi:hypothetical protein